MKVATNRLVAGIVLANLDNESERADFNQRLEIAEDLLAALGLHEDFHLSIWAEHRRKRATSHANNHVVDKAPINMKKAKRRKSSIRRGESY
jgi:hypothetical protein